ncbi:hypothetical protein CEXT_7081 [Caerostris extrusa]|uniref:Uncharacterized protein n=1 Tax=Caerostris extrusa TaxID=172846 RepID=A0AAV4RBF1_CAEEX|nr:hypothetical protein CEXT_7081 [Caerostris extrusa]
MQWINPFDVPYLLLKNILRKLIDVSTIATNACVISTDHGSTEIKFTGIFWNIRSNTSDSCNEKNFLTLRVLHTQQLPKKEMHAATMVNFFVEVVLDTVLELLVHSANPCTKSNVACFLQGDYYSNDYEKADITPPAP